MPKPFRAVPTDVDPPIGELTIMAETDFEALTRARDNLGSETSFDLWQGSRLALRFRPHPSTEPRRE